MIYLLHEKPPIWDRIKEVFNISWERGIYVTYGDTVYSVLQMTPEIEAHESVHIKQQTEMGKDLWWDKYLTDKQFRLDQEVEAYLAQVKHIQENGNSHYRKFRFNMLCKDLSSGIYGNCCDFPKAKKLLGFN